MWIEWRLELLNTGNVNCDFVFCIIIQILLNRYRPLKRIPEHLFNFGVDISIELFTGECI